MEEVGRRAVRCRRIALRSQTPLVDLVPHAGALPDPVLTLERYFAEGGTSLARAVFREFVLRRSGRRPYTDAYFPGYARASRQHYGNLHARDHAVWEGSPFASTRQQGADGLAAVHRQSPLPWKGVRPPQIWGHPRDPTAFTAGWNLAYMAHWAGMLTESQHPHALIQKAVRQARWELNFRENPVCTPPSFVFEPGMDLAACSALWPPQKWLVCRGKRLQVWGPRSLGAAMGSAASSSRSG
jgi:hypothetical protein